MRHIGKTTHDLQPGDIVNNHGMRLLIDQPINTSRSHPMGDDEHGPCLWTSALCLNAADFEPGAEREDAFIRYHLTVDTAEPRWTIQGNGLATWHVEIAD